MTWILKVYEIPRLIEYTRNTSLDHSARRLDVIMVTCNIYVSVAQPSDKGTNQGYRKAVRTWMLSIESHHRHLPGLAHQDQEPVHYKATLNEESGALTVSEHSADSEPAIIGNILIAEDANTSPEKFRHIIQDACASGSPHGKHNVDEAPETWVWEAMRAMQEHKICERFSIDEFMTFARGYEAHRMNNEGSPALIAYPKIHPDHEKKSSKSKFWISHPMSGRTTNNGGEARIYGGLM